MPLHFVKDDGYGSSLAVQREPEGGVLLLASQGGTISARFELTEADWLGMFAAMSHASDTGYLVEQLKLLHNGKGLR